MAEHDKDLYFVAVKLLLRDGDKLLITHDIFGVWDLPSDWLSGMQEYLRQQSC